MSGIAGGAQLPGAQEPRRDLFRWECRCRETPVLLATYDASGRINIKARDRYWHVLGVVQTICPRCGSEHTLDLRRPDGETARRPVESREDE